MTRDELQLLRSEASRFLADLSALPGFAKRRSAIPAVPNAAAELPFWSIRSLASANHTRKVIWRRWHFPDDVPDSQARAALNDFAAKGLPTKVQGDDGIILRKPEWVSAPKDGPDRDALESYREEVEAFADRFLLSSQWAASALHDALRSGGPIELPKAPPEGFVCVPLRAPITLDPKEPRTREELRALSELLAQVASDQGEPELQRTRDGVWRGALDAVAGELDGRRLTATQRGNRGRARRLLDGAVNGKFDLDQPIDWAYDREIGAERDEGTPGTPG